MTTESASVVDRSGSMPDLGEFRILRGAQRDHAYMAVEHEVRRLQAVQAAMLSEVSRSGSYLDDCHRTPVAWVRAVTNSSKGAAMHAMHTAAMQQRMPRLAAAAAAGQIGPDQLRQLTRLWANDRCRDLLPDSDELLTGTARALTYHEFRLVCQRWQAHADPERASRS